MRTPWDTNPAALPARKKAPTSKPGMWWMAGCGKQTATFSLLLWCKTREPFALRPLPGRLPAFQPHKDSWLNTEGSSSPEGNSAVPLPNATKGGAPPWRASSVNEHQTSPTVLRTSVQSWVSSRNDAFEGGGPLALAEGDLPASINFNF